MAQNKEEFVGFLEPKQSAISVAGGGKLVFSIRMLAEERRDFVVVEVSRASIIEALEEKPCLQHLAGHAGAVLAPAYGWESGRKKWEESKEGTAQGDAVSSPYFNVSWHK